MNKNPDKWIRKAVSDLINNMVVSGKTIPCVDTNYTGDTQPLFHVAMSTQTKGVSSFNKCKKKWNCTVLLDIITRYSSPGNIGTRVLLNDIEEAVILRMNNFSVEGGFENYKDIEIENSRSLDIHTDTEVCFRQLVRLYIELIEI